MEKKKTLPNITTNNVDSFKKIEEYLLALPECIFDMIDSARFNGVGCECTFKQQYKEVGKYLILPPTQISEFGDYVGIYCGDYFFKIDGANLNKKREYQIIEFPKPTKK